MQSSSDWAAQQLSQGVSSHIGGDLAAAERIYCAIIARDERPVEATRLLGVLMVQKNRLGDGIELLKRTLAMAPDYPLALDNLGVALKNAQRHDEAIACFDRALELKPDYIEVENNRAITFFECRRFGEALEGYGKVLANRPDHLGALNDRALILKELDRHDEALTCLDRAASLQPNDVKTLNNRGVTLKELGRHDEAIACYDRVLALVPHYADALHNRGNALLELCKPKDALMDFDRAHALAPDNAEYNFSAAVCQLQMGDFARGWKYYESRKTRTAHRAYFRTREFSQPLLGPGEALQGKSIFLYWEQGYGDTLQFCRFAKMAASRGAQVVLSAQNRLHKLLKTLGPTVELIDEAQAPARFDAHAPLMSMALVLGLDFDALPGEIVYLQAEADRIALWRDRIGRSGFRIGVAWTGSTENKFATNRSFPLAELEILAQIPGVRLISLQKHDGVEQLLALAEGFVVETLGEDFDCGDDAFLDAAAVMASLDLVITCDTSIAHLAGALGRPAWLALKYAPEWRWSLGRSDSPWYPTLRLFRQQKQDDWRGLFAEMALSLRQCLELRDTDRAVNS